MTKEFSIFALDDDEAFCTLLESLSRWPKFIRGVDGYNLNLTVFRDIEHLDKAVDYIKENTPNLVLLDYYLEPLGCAAAVDVLKEIILCCREVTDVIVMTGLCAADTRFKLINEALGKMEMAVIQKPFTIAKLLEVIEESVRRKEHS